MLERQEEPYFEGFDCNHPLAAVIERGRKALKARNNKPGIPFEKLPPPNARELKQILNPQE
jgi:hypothetical protein